MKKIIIALSVLLIGTNVFAASRVIRTVQPLRYGPSQHCHCCDHHQYRRGYAPSRYRSYPRGNYFNGSTNFYMPQQRVTPFTPVNRTMFYPNRNVIYRYGGHVEEANIKDISYNDNVNFHDVNLSLVEQDIYGKSFEHQDMNLRLNRLEKSMFNRTYPKMSYEERVNNLFVNYNSEKKQISDSNLSRLELNLFNRTYNNESEAARVARLEQKMLGAIQQGDIQERVNVLNSLSNQNNYSSNIKPSYGTCYGGYPAYGGNTGWRGFLSSLGMYFGGCPTGFTPGIDPYYSDNFGMNENGDSSYYTGNRGWQYNNSRSGSGTGVTILD